MGFGITVGDVRVVAGGAVFAGGDDVVCWWQFLYGTVAKGDAAQDSDVFFKT